MLLKICAECRCSKFLAELTGKTFPRLSVLLKFVRTGSLPGLRCLLCVFVCSGFQEATSEGILGDGISIAAIHPGGQSAP